MRAIHFLIKLTQTHSRCPHVPQTIRVSSRVLDGLSGVSVALDFGDVLATEKVRVALNDVGFFADDRIRFNYEAESMQLVISSGELDKRWNVCQRVEIFFSHELVPSSGALRAALQKRTVYGMPISFYRSTSIGKLKWYFGASQHELSMRIESDSSSVSAFNGHPYFLKKNSRGIVELIYLDTRNALKHKELTLESYLTRDAVLRLRRHSFKPKVGITLYLDFPVESIEVERPLSDWNEFSRDIEASVSNELQNHLRSQVSRIEARIHELENRSQLYFKGHFIGYLPYNELETVIILERYLNVNNGRLGTNARFTLLDYSPSGIDGIAAFSPTDGTPITKVPVEFEYQLSNFFSHGHDPLQVRLVLCFTRGSLEFPFDHFGVVYNLISHSNGLYRLVNEAGEELCFVFILNEVIQAN